MITLSVVSNVFNIHAVQILKKPKVSEREREREREKETIFGSS